MEETKLEDSNKHRNKQKKNFLQKKRQTNKKKAKTGPRGNAVKFLLNNPSPQEGTRKDKQSITKKIKNKQFFNFSIVSNQSGCLENLKARDVIIFFLWHFS